MYMYKVCASTAVPNSEDQLFTFIKMKLILTSSVDTDESRIISMNINAFRQSWDRRSPLKNESRVNPLRLQQLRC